MGEIDGTAVKQPIGVLCWTCGTVKESLARPGQSDEAYVREYHEDPGTQSEVKGATKVLVALGLTAETEVKHTSQVQLEDVYGAKHFYLMAFVQLDHFNCFYGVPPDACGYTLTKKPNIDLEEVPGIYVKYTPDWPEDLPFSLTEFFLKEQGRLSDFLHDKNDLHPNHGRCVFNNVAHGLTQQRPPCARSGNWAKVLTLDDILAKVKEVSAKRAERASALLSSTQAVEAKAVPMVISSSRLNARGQLPATRAATAAEVPKAAGVGQRRPSGNGGPPIRRSKPSVSLSAYVTPEKPGNSRGSGLSLAPSPPAVPGSRANVAANGVAGGGAAPAVVSFAFAPPSASAGDAAAGTAGDAEKRVDDGRPKLGGIRGSPEVGVADVFEGYNPGRELKAATHPV